jgi:hypothetical protein
LRVHRRCLIAGTALALVLTSYVAPAHAHDQTLYAHAELSAERQFLRDAADAYALVELIENTRAWYRAAARVEPEPAPTDELRGAPQPEWTPEGADVSGFLACTREIESNGDYTVHSSNGKWHGAYQFLQSTWDSTARSAGRPDLVGVNPANASVGDQDSMAAHLYSQQGNRPWGGRC